MSNSTSFTAAAPLTLVPGSPRSAQMWRDRCDAVGFAGRTGAVLAHQSIHNSMKPMGAAPVNAFDTGHRVYAAKQAAPPRGRYR